MEIIIKNNYSEISIEASGIVANQNKSKPNTVLGLATGSTPLGLYKELIRLHINEGLDFSKVISFNLDEYIGLSKDHPQSYNYFMYHNFFKKVNIPANNIHIPNGISVKQLEYCEQYESLIKNSGGIDLQILGIGRDGHIAFNEPSSSLSSRTRIKTLTQKTIKDNSRFFKNISDVPRFAITMGVGTIMEAKKIILLASGSSKAEPIAQSVEGPITSMHSASAIQLHPNTTIVVDRQASKELKEKKYYNWVYKNKNVIYNQSYN